MGSSVRSFPDPQIDVSPQMMRVVEKKAIRHRLQEYKVTACDVSSPSASCVHSAESSSPIPKGGHIIFSVAHQHNGGMGSTIYGEVRKQVSMVETWRLAP